MKNLGSPIGYSADLHAFRKKTAGGIEPGDMATICRIMQDYHYGKNLRRLLEPETRFKVIVSGDRIILRNYDFLPPREGSGIRGVCHELSRALGQKLRRLFGGKYQFIAVLGKARRFFSSSRFNHIFLAGGTSERIAALKDRLARGACESSGETAILDPSFGVAPGHPDLPGYRIEGVKNTAEEDASGDGLDCFTVESFNPNGSSPALPLGFLEDLSPGDKNQDGQKTLLYLRFVRRSPEGPVEPWLARQTENEETVSYWDNWRNEISSDSPLMALMNKLEQDLNNPDPADLREIDARQLETIQDFFWQKRKSSCRNALGQLS